MKRSCTLLTYSLSVASVVTDNRISCRGGETIIIIIIIWAAVIISWFKNGANKIENKENKQL